MFYRITWFILIIFVILPVAGMIIMWVRKSWSSAVRIILTILFSVYVTMVVIILMPLGNQTQDDQTEQEHVEQNEQDQDSDKEQAEDNQEQEEEKNKPPQHDTNQTAGDVKQQYKQPLEKLSGAELLSIQGMFDQEPYSIELVLDGIKGETESSTVQNMEKAVLEAIYVVKDAAYDIEDLNINVTYPSTHKNGQDKEQFAIKAKFSGQTIDNLANDRSNTDADQLNTIADSWWKHPVLNDS